jgi:class 3 adenylate cyclase/CHASE2 domain-containing sensor protein
MSPALLGRLRLLGVLVLIPLALLLSRVPVVARLDLALFDLQSQILRQIAPRPAPAPDPVLIGIDEATYRALPEPFALWHRHFGRLFGGLAAAGAGPVGLDVVLPDRSFDFLLPGQDRALLSGLLRLRQGGGVIAGITVDDSGRPRAVHPPLLAAAGPRGRAFVLWRLDADRVVRRYAPLLDPADPDSRVLVTAMMETMGRTPRPGLIDYTVGPAWTYTPLHLVLSRIAAGDDAWMTDHFAGRPVILGTVLPFEDRRLQPVALAAWEPEVRNVPGVLIHGQALRAQLAGRVIAEGPPWLPPLLALAALAVWFAARRPWVGVTVLGGVTGVALAGSTALLHGGIALPVAGTVVASGLAVGGRSILESLAAVAEKNRLRRLFSGYVSPAVLRDLLAGRADAGTAGHRREVCLLFSDIRDFTTRSEKLPPEDVVALLNRYFDDMVQAIHGNGGTVDKFIGDGLMAFFGAPQSLPDPCANAYAAARDMLVRLARLNARLTEEGIAPLHIGIGLHVGPAVIGNVGPPERHEYTAIGDVVNTCSRVEGLTKSLGCALLVTEQVAAALGPAADLVQLGETPVKGRAPVMVHGWRGGMATPPRDAPSAPPPPSAPSIEGEVS